MTGEGHEVEEEEGGGLKEGECRERSGKMCYGRRNFLRGGGRLGRVGGIRSVNNLYT